jgi:hypothetical protein
LALAVAVVAVPKQRPALTMSDREATIVLVRRDTARLDAERVTTDLGTALVTTVEQTLLDLAHRPDFGNFGGEAGEAVRAWWPRADQATLQTIAENQRLRTALVGARGWAGA